MDSAKYPFVDANKYSLLFPQPPVLVQQTNHDIPYKPIQWSNDTKNLIKNCLEDLSINDYNWTILSDNVEAIKSSQSHLIGLIKYYEGDRHHYYEAFTAKYKDKDGEGTMTGGFGSTTNPDVKTIEQGYEQLAKDLQSHGKDAKDAIGEDNWNKLPVSIREALVDLCFNKGKDAITKISGVIANAILSNDWSSIINNLIVIKDKDGNDDAGLYRRSLSRAILATRDLKGKELKGAKAELNKIYNKCLNFKGQSKSDVEAIWKIYNGDSDVKRISSESIKITIEQGNTLWNISSTYFPNVKGKDNKDKLIAEILRFNGIKADDKEKDKKINSLLQIGQQINIPLEFDGKKVKFVDLVKPSEENVKIVDGQKHSPDSKKVGNYRLVDDSELVEINPSDYENFTYWSIATKIYNEYATPDFTVKDLSEKLKMLNGGTLRASATTIIIPKIVDISNEQNSNTSEVNDGVKKQSSQDDNTNLKWSMTEKTISFKISNAYKGKGYWAVANDIIQKYYQNFPLSVSEFAEIIKNYNPNVEFQEGKIIEIPVFEKVVDSNVSANQEDSSELIEEKVEDIQKKYIYDNFSKLGKPIEKSIGAKGKNLKLQIFTYKVQSGQGFLRIANMFGIDPKTLKDFNGGENFNTKKLILNQEIKIPRIIYEVQNGGKLEDVAEKFNLDNEMLQKINADGHTTLKKGENIAIPGYIHVVKEGDNLYNIAKNAGISLDELKEINDLDLNNIKIGQTLVILYRDANYNISEDKKITTVIETSKTNKPEKITTVVANKTRVGDRKYLKKRIDSKGNILATREVFKPTKKGPLSGRTIIVNAGHGYRPPTKDGVIFDEGASEESANAGLKKKGKKTPQTYGLPNEALINYDNAMRLKDNLVNQGARVIYLQGNVNLIAEELKKKENKADLFISIHVNVSDEKPDMSATQFYYAKNANKSNSKVEKGYLGGRKLAYLCDKAFDKQYNPVYSKSIDKNYLVTRTARDLGLPNLLWEVDFISSEQGRNNLNNPKKLDNYCFIISNVIKDYFTKSKDLQLGTILAGDTLNKIAKRYGTTSDELKKTNPGLSDNNLVAGSTIVIP